jgi:hypothetical protein
VGLQPEMRFDSGGINTPSATVIIHSPTKPLITVPFVYFNAPLKQGHVFLHQITFFIFQWKLT